MRTFTLSKGWLVWRVAISVILLLASQALAAQIRPGDLAARQTFSKKVIEAAVERTHHTVRYDPAYVRIPYPGGDVPADTGVCTDEIIRAYRAVGVDLQKEVHEDMERNLSAYPRKWRWLSWHTDTNIDHRRVPNLIVFFSARENRWRLRSARRTTRRATWSPGTCAEMCRILESWSIKNRVPAGATCSSTTSGGGRRSKMCFSIGRLRGITAIAGRLRAIG